MIKNRNIPLIQAAVIEPFILAAREIGTPIERVLMTAGLSSEILDTPNLIVPEIPAWKLVQTIAQMEGTPLLGLYAAFSLAHQDIKSVEPLIKGCINLKALLERFCFIAPTQTNTDEYALMECGELVWFIQKGPRLTSNYVQVELFEIAGMIQLVQLAAGAHWRPSEIHFSFKYCHHVDNAEEFNPGKILFSQQYPAIAIPRNLLPLKIPELGTPHHSKLSTPPDTIKDQLLCAISPYLEEKLNPARLSQITGMSFRTLQRILEQQDTSISGVIDQARFEKAQFLLKNTSEKLLGISLLLGYQNASTFSRAFKRWSGLSPREFRNNYILEN